MKTQILSFTVFFGLIAGLFADEPTKPLVSLTVKRQLLSADKDVKGPRAESQDKEMTLRVEIRNISTSLLEGAELTGDVLVNRAVNDREKIVKELLKAIKLPPLKPNQTVTVDLGNFTLNKHKWHGRTFEETLEEWKVVCKKGETDIGQNLSDEKYNALIKEMKDQKEENKDEVEDRMKDDDRTKELIRRKKLRQLRD